MGYNIETQGAVYSVEALEAHIAKVDAMEKMKVDKTTGEVIEVDIETLIDSAPY